MITLTQVKKFKVEFPFLTGSTRYDDSYFYFPGNVFDVLIKDNNVFITNVLFEY